MTPPVRFKLSAHDVPAVLRVGRLVRDDGDVARRRRCISPASRSGWPPGTTALAAMISPFFVGMVADRFLATEKILGGAAPDRRRRPVLASTQTTFGAFYGVLLVYTLCYMPTLALSNSISFHQMSDPEREFPGDPGSGDDRLDCRRHFHRNPRPRGDRPADATGRRRLRSFSDCSALPCLTRRRRRRAA